MASKALSVSEFANLLVSKYLKHSFSSDSDENLSIAAEELYVLLRKLKDAAGEKSEDMKAPLKAIRAAIDNSYAQDSEHGSALPSQAEALFVLLGALEALCEGRMARGIEGEQAAQIQAVLRYRMTRLVTGDAWDSKPALKLRTLQLMFDFMVRENAALRAQSRGFGGEAGGPPGLRLSRSRSFGKGRGGGGGSGGGGPVHHPPRSKWQDAINELAKMQGSKLLPLMKLLLVENMRATDALAAARTGPAAAGPAAAEVPAARKEQAPVGGRAASSVAAPGTPEQAPLGQAPATRHPSNLDDLLGLNDGLIGGEEGGMQRTSSAANSSGHSSAVVDDPFAVLAESRGQAGPHRGLAPPPGSTGHYPSEALPVGAASAGGGRVQGVSSQLGAMSIGGPGTPPPSAYHRPSPPDSRMSTASYYSSVDAGGNVFPQQFTHSQPGFAPTGVTHTGIPASPTTPPSHIPYHPQSSPSYPGGSPAGGFQGSPHTHPAFFGSGSGELSLQFRQASPGVGPGGGQQGFGGAAAFPGAPATAGGAWGVTAGSGAQRQGSSGLGTAGSFGMGAGGERVAEPSFDTSSPYFGMANPFGDSAFAELSPMRAHRPPPPPPPAGTTLRSSPSK